MNSLVARFELVSGPLAYPLALESPASGPLRERMSCGLDALSLKFVIASRKAKGPVLDFGCGEGIASAAALARGAHVCAVDSDERAIRQLLSRVPSQQHRRLHARVGSLTAVDFKQAHFDAVHAARVLHEFDGETLEALFRKFFRWLYPGGRLFISALTPDGSFWRSLHHERLLRPRADTRWPGYIHDSVGSFHLLDDETLRRELEAVGFEIEELADYLLPWDSTQMCCSVVARCAP